MNGQAVNGQAVNGQAGKERAGAALGGIIAPLFVPAHRPERFAKAAASGADAIILDLEDAVPVEAKEAARAALRSLPDSVPVLVRINAAGTPWHEDDLAALGDLPLAGIVLPKAEALADIARVVLSHPVVALIETARGLVEARQIAAAPGVARLAFGSIDFAADLGCGHEREALASARCELVLASRLAGLAAPLDGVTANFRDDAAAAGDARYARMLGFGGKLAIHPQQVAPILGGFRPLDEEADWARRVLASGDGAVALDGAMIDAPVRARAHWVLARLAAVDRAGRGG